MEPLTFLAIRFPIAGALFVAIALALGSPWPGRKLALHAMVAGAFLHGGYLGPVSWEGDLSLLHISAPPRPYTILYDVFCLKKKKKTQ